MYEKVVESKNYINSKTDTRAKVGLILGSGLGSLVDSMEEMTTIDYEDIPNFPKSTVEGHEGRLAFGKIGGTEVVAMQGRFHYYEGYTMKEVTYPVYVMKMMGVEKLIVTNSCGGINTGFEPGTLMIINDFINLMGANPLFGPNDERFGPRFPDMTEPYKLDLIDLARKTGDELNISYGEGVYAGFVGPYYETAAEIRAFGRMGADAIGMSTVPETIAANYLGMDVLGIACITNMATGIQKKKHSHEHVVQVANKASADFCRWLEQIIGQI
ncbi:purine-nucleoside phosphorylase [Dethiosulfatibacter aminovorans]|nr:purine-nucleoside phosphorylase [Dethiosulfatibacter aminovorans]